MTIVEGGAGTHCRAARYIVIRIQKKDIVQNGFRWQEVGK
jgi:hypothetical protein